MLSFSISNVAVQMLHLSDSKLLHCSCRAYSQSICRLPACLLSVLPLLHQTAAAEEESALTLWDATNKKESRQQVQAKLSNLKYNCTTLQNNARHHVVVQLQLQHNSGRTHLYAGSAYAAYT
jgi:hypothetical protein